MKNFEYWKDEIIDIIDLEGLAVVNGRPALCDDYGCSKCDFYDKTKPCSQVKREWLYEEHIDRPTLTKKERLFCELVETGWIARDEDEKLFWYSRKKPNKEEKQWREYAENLKSFNIQFDFIHWEDCQPWSVEDLLKLDAKD